MKVRHFAVAVAVALFSAFSALAQTQHPPKLSALPFDLESLRSSIAPLTACYAGTVGCAQTRTGRVSIDSCDSDGLYGVGYSYTGTAGSMITITGHSPSFGATIALADGRSGRTTIYAQDDVFTNGATASINNFVLPYTGPYIILITPGVRYTFGDYTLTVSCPTSNATCTPDSTSACLLSNRFRVKIDYVNPFSNPPNQQGAFAATRLNPSALNPDVALFGFDNPQAVEVVVRIVDARPFAPRFDVYYGGLTDVKYTLTVTDTQTGKSRQYVNNVGQVGGGVDRSTFPAW